LLEGLRATEEGVSVNGMSLVIGRLESCRCMGRCFDCYHVAAVLRNGR
jgi:hypothetical protein